MQVRLLLQCLVFIVVEVTCHDYEWDSFHSDFYREDQYLIHSVRICTKCSEGHPECMQEASTLFQKKKEDYEKPNFYPDLFDPFALEDWKTELVEENLKLSCWLESDTDDSSLHGTDEMVHTVTTNKKALGKIFINRAYFGKDFHQNCELNTDFDFCFVSSFNKRRFYGLCYSQYDCELYGLPSYIPQCGQFSDFLHVDYQCIPESHIYDMAEYSSSKERNSSSFGYIMSPHFPRPSDIRSSFECVLEITDTTVQGSFVFTNLDFHLTYGNQWGCCFYEYVEIQSIKEDTLVFRKRYCGQHKTGEMLTVNGNKIRVVYATDWYHAWNEKGFWTKYQGFDNATGLPVRVEVSCGFFDPYNKVTLPVAPGVQTYEGQWCTEDYDGEEEAMAEEDEGIGQEDADTGVEDEESDRDTSEEKIQGSGESVEEAQEYAGQVKNESQGKNIAPIAAGVGVSVMIAVGIAVAIYCWRRRSNNNKDMENLESRIEQCPPTSTEGKTVPKNDLPNQLSKHNNVGESSAATTAENKVYHNATTCNNNIGQTNTSIFDDDAYEMLPDCVSSTHVNRTGYETPRKIQEFQPRDKDKSLQVPLHVENVNMYTTLQPETYDYVAPTGQS